MSIITYPLDGKYYNAQDAETYLCTRTSGVFSEDISFTPNGMNITVSPFLAWIKNDDFSGKSVAVKTDTTLTISPSEPILPRIDRIILRFDARKNESNLMILKGTHGSKPTPPSIERTPVIYDLCLCEVYVRPSATSISAGDITSTLLDESICGIMRDGVTAIPSNQLVAQCQNLIKELNTAISMAEKGSPVLQSLGIKCGTITIMLGGQGQKIYESGDIFFDVPFLSEPSVVITRCAGITQDETVAKYVKPQESVYVNKSSFKLSVFREVTDMVAELRYNWIAIGKVDWSGDGGGDEVEYCNIRTTISPEGTGTTTGAGNYAKGSTVTLNATPASGYAFEGWYIGSSKITSNASYNITVTSDTIYTAKFVEEVPMITVTVTTDPVGAGSVSGAGTYPKGSTVRLTASPGDRYRFIGWYSGDTLYSPNTEYSVTLNSSMAFVAKFEEEVVTPDYYTIITKVSPTGAGSTTGGGQYAAGTSVKLTATANEGYLFSHWSKGTETRATAEITVAATTDQTWTANFIEGEEDTEEKVTITINVEPEGAGTVAGNGEVNSGAMSAIQATANSGYKFKHWRFEDGTTNEANPYLFKASADRTFVAVFEVENLVITISPEGAGEVTITEGETYEYGTIKTLEAIPASGYNFSHWLVANTTEYTENPYQIVVQEGSHYNIKAVFEQETTTEKKTITILGSIGTTKVVCNGVELSNSRSNFTHEFNIGDEVTLTFTPDSGNAFASWLNDDTLKALSYDNPWTFTVDSSTATNIGITISET